MIESTLKKKIEDLGLDERGVKTPLQKAMDASHTQKKSQSEKGSFIQLMQSKIAGTTYIQNRNALAALRPGDILALEKDGDNRFDPRAVAIYDADGVQVGFIPKEDNEAVNSLIEAGKTLVCEILSIDNRGKYFDIDIVIILKED